MQATANARLQRMRSLMLASLGATDESFELAQAA